MILVDANIFMYAAGRASPQRDPCRNVLQRIAAGEEDACTDAEVLQEILHRYHALRIPEIGFSLVDSVVRLGLPVLPVAEEDVLRARQLMAHHPRLSARDAVHLGVMQGRRLDRVLTYDRGFSAVPWVERVEP